jgi:hypothetical protein
MTHATACFVVGSRALPLAWCAHLRARWASMHELCTRPGTASLSVSVLPYSLWTQMPVLSVLADVAAGLAYLHGHGIIHGGASPMDPPALHELSTWHTP